MSTTGPSWPSAARTSTRGRGGRRWPRGTSKSSPTPASKSWCSRPTAEQSTRRWGAETWRITHFTCQEVRIYTGDYYYYYYYYSLYYLFILCHSNSFLFSLYDIWLIWLNSYCTYLMHIRRYCNAFLHMYLYTYEEIICNNISIRVHLCSFITFYLSHVIINIVSSNFCYRFTSED